ncbi:MAG TPA: hypothetical protein VGJ97_08515 [Anaerolineaceae bacterium]|jgi:threonine/homoserine/homoserine lactone efflux protein
MLTTSGRIGCFFLLIATGLLVLFLASDSVHYPQFNYLVGGLFLGLLGWVLWRKGRTPPRKSSRFRILRGRSEDDESN